MPEDGRPLSFAVETLSIQYEPYLALMLTQEQCDQLLAEAEHNAPSSVLSAPTITLFSGQSANIIDESQSPFVVGVHYVHGELASAAQPNIAVLSEGARIDVLPCVVEPETLDLNCRMTFSHIVKVDEVKLPGQRVTVQAPTAIQKNLSIHCQVKSGETLLVGSPKREGQKDSFFYLVKAEWMPDRN